MSEKRMEMPEREYRLERVPGTPCCDLVTPEGWRVRISEHALETFVQMERGEAEPQSWSALYLGAADGRALYCPLDALLGGVRALAAADTGWEQAGRIDAIRRELAEIDAATHRLAALRGGEASGEVATPAVAAEGSFARLMDDALAAISGPHEGGLAGGVPPNVEAAAAFRELLCVPRPAFVFREPDPPASPGPWTARVDGGPATGHGATAEEAMRDVERAVAATSWPCCSSTLLSPPLRQQLGLEVGWDHDPAVLQDVARRLGTTLEFAPGEVAMPDHHERRGSAVEAEGPPLDQRIDAAGQQVECDVQAEAQRRADGVVRARESRRITGCQPGVERP